MPGVGFEPTRSQEQQGLGLPRLPFRHPGQAPVTIRKGADVPSSVRVRLRMTIRAKDPQIGQTIVISFAVDMVQLKRDRATVPFLAEASLASVRLQAFLDEPPLQGACVQQPPVDE